MGKFFRAKVKGNRRRYFSYWVTAMVGVLVFEASMLPILGPLFDNVFQGYFFVAVALFFFAVVVGGAIYLTTKGQQLDPVRLVRDGMLSIAMNILAFAVLFRNIGIHDGTTCIKPSVAVDAIYFSAVTFSTLGDGDFKPCAFGRLFAASEAIVGNLHLGMIVGAAFFLVQKAAEEKV